MAALPVIEPPAMALSEITLPAPRAVPPIEFDAAFWMSTPSPVLPGSPVPNT
ncbi:MAG TPA: hypothetical protein VFF52_27190 [Isosphaeraceae bacterium]|nr:hypothetical protein [Isosphaeraceae bacterium]